MKKCLLIAEKPSYMRDLQACYEKHRAEIPYDIDFMAQAGHVVELLSPSEMDEAYKNWDETLLPIEPENMGGFKYRVISGMGNIVKEAKSSIHSGDYDMVIHAGDPDQEGELLTRLLLKAVKNDLPVLRIWPNDTTDNGLLQAFKSMKSDSDTNYENLFQAGLVRQHSDWRFGMNGSRAVANRMKTSEKVAVGRVMTAVQAMIVHREDEIQSFIPQTTYGIECEFDKCYKGQLFTIETTTDPQTNEEKQTNELTYFKTKAEAEEMKSKIGNMGTIVFYSSTKTTKYAPKLYDLAEAQIDGTKLGYSPDKTQDIIQSLYEKHIITYPRTDCCVLSSSENFDGMLDAMEHITEFQDAVSVARKSLPRIMNMSKYVNDKELQNHGHSALVPTTERAVVSALSKEEQDIYTMICRRFLAIFQPPLIENKLKIITDVDGNLFLSNGKTVADAGYTAFLGIHPENNPLPVVTKGDKTQVLKTDICERTSTPPKRFTMGTIVEAMKNPKKYLEDMSISTGIDDFHIGTSATRAEILKKLIKDKFIKEKGNTLYPTEWGSFFIHKLNDVDITKVDMTGKWEHLLEDVKNGTITGEQAEDVMRKEVRKMVNDILHMEKYSFGDVNVNKQLVGTCPSCGKNIISSNKGYYCEGWKDGCKNTVTAKFLGARITPKEAMALFKGDTIMKTLKKDDKTWTQVLGLDTSEERAKLTFIKREGKSDLLCPLCKQNLERSGSKLTCECGFNIWTNPCKRELTEQELYYIFEKGHSHGEISGLKSREGKPFSAKLILKMQKDSGFELKFSKHKKKIW